MSGSMRGRVVGAGYYVLVGLVTALLTVPLLHLTTTHLSLPYNYGGDGLAGSARIKTVLEQGWFDFTPRLGAPEGQHGNDFPGADNLHPMLIWLLARFNGSWVVAIHAYYLLTFPLTAMASAWFFRVVGVGRVLGAAMAVLYAFAPYHIYRSEGHLFLAAYYVVPLAGVFLYRAVSGESLWSRRPTGSWLTRWSTLRNLGLVGVLAVLGTASSYYSIFALLLLTVAALVALIQDGRWRRVLGVVSAQVLLVGVMVVNMLPNVLYQQLHGPNLIPVGRSPRLSEHYAFKLASLVFPSRSHRIGDLSNFRFRYDRTFPLASEPSALGLFAAGGLIFLLSVAVLGLALSARRGTTASDWWTTQRRLAVLTLTGFFFGTVGGLSTFFALFVSDSLRGWNRMSIYLALFSLAAVGLVLQRLAARCRPRLVQPVAWVLAVVVVTVGVLDQVPRNFFQTPALTITSFQSDKAFVAAVERALPPGSAVLQLPYLASPEASAVQKMKDSDPLRMYLHSQTLRWSYGGIKGRPEADWAASISAETPDRVAAFGSLAGFSGIELDRFGYADKGREVERGLAQVLGVQPVVSSDARFTFWDIRAYGEVVALRHVASEVAEVREHVLRHPIAYPQGFGLSATPRIAFANPLPTTQVVVATVTLVASDRPSQVRFVWPDGTVELVSASRAAFALTRQLALPPGISWAQVSTPDTAVTANKTPTSEVRYRFRRVTLPDRVLAEFRP